MEYLTITEINDFIFCPASIYFHNLYSNIDKSAYYSSVQYKGLAAHSSIDSDSYSSSRSIITGKDVYSEKYKLSGNIDIYYTDKCLLVERKKKINQIFDGYIFQLYGQYFGMTESGYRIEQMKLYSFDDNKSYNVELPERNPEMLEKFETMIKTINEFDLNSFEANNLNKCRNCIYSNICSFSLYDE